MAKNNKKQTATLFDQFNFDDSFEKIQAKSGAKATLSQKKSEEELEKERRQRAKNKEGFSTTGDLLSRFQIAEKNKHISHEFQSFGCHLANVLDDKKHTGLYIKMAKNMSRGMLEKALSFVIDSTADNKAKLFMWKVSQLKAEKKNEKKNDADKN